MTLLLGLSQSQRLRARSGCCEPSGEIEGGVSCSPARWMMVDGVRAELLVTGGSCQADLLRQRPRVGLPRPQACETCGGTAPRPASATPRERAPHRTRMSVAIAELRATVKNKVRTLHIPTPAPRPLPAAGEGGPRVSEGRERGSHRMNSAPLPARSARHPPPQKGGGFILRPSRTRSGWGGPSGTTPPLTPPRPWSPGAAPGTRRTGATRGRHRGRYSSGAPDGCPPPRSAPHP